MNLERRHNCVYILSCNDTPMRALVVSRLSVIIHFQVDDSDLNVFVNSRMPVTEKVVSKPFYAVRITEEEVPKLEGKDGTEVSCPVQALYMSNNNVPLDPS